MSNSSDSSSGPEAAPSAPLDYAPPEKPQRFGKTCFGYVAVVLAAGFLALHVLFYKLPRGGAQQRDSNFLFDFGVIYVLLIFAFALLGLLQNRASQIASLIALAVTLGSCAM